METPTQNFGGGRVWKTGLKGKFFDCGGGKEFFSGTEKKTKGGFRRLPRWDGGTRRVLFFFPFVDFFFGGKSHNRGPPTEKKSNRVCFRDNSVGRGGAPFTGGFRLSGFRRGIWRLCGVLGIVVAKKKKKQPKSFKGAFVPMGAGVFVWRKRGQKTKLVKGAGPNRALFQSRFFFTARGGGGKKLCEVWSNMKTFAPNHFQKKGRECD